MKLFPQVSSNPYLLPFLYAFLLHISIFLFGALVEFLSNIICQYIGRILGYDVANFIRNRLTFVGTVHHELAHAFFATISGAKVTKMKLFAPEGDRLGYVEFYTRGNAMMQAVQFTLSGIAPVICGGVNIFLLYFVMVNYCNYIWQYVIIGYVMISIFFHMNMSRQDVVNALRGVWFTMLVSYGVFLFLERISIL